MAKQKWSPREYRDGDEEQIRELQRICFSLSSANNSQWWKWQFINSPDGTARIWLAEAKQKVVGHYAILPLRMKIENETKMGSFSLDTMTHPDYQHQGIFVTLANRTYDDASNNDIIITYGTPNDQSYPGFIRKLQWFDICTVPLLVKVIAWGNILKGRLGIPTFIGNILGYIYDNMTSHGSLSQNVNIETEQILSFDERIDEFWLNASNMKSIMVVKDRKYLNWRYVDKPGHNYKIFIAKRRGEIVGYIVLTQERDDLAGWLIVDLLTLPNEDTAAQVLITRAIGYSKEKGAAKISCWMLQGAVYYRTLKKMGFIGRRSLLRLCARINVPRLSEEFVANPNNWYFVRGDNDSE
jgi:hypothetical protein